MKLNEALKKLREDAKERKFDQSVDLIVNLKGINIKKDNISIVANIPNKIKDKKVCGFLTKQSKLVKTITFPEFPKFKDKKALKNLVKDYDFFISVAPLMPKVATTFGKVLGPTGKMPSPQLGIITVESEEEIQKTLDKIAKSIKIRAKEASIKLIVGKAGMKDEDIMANLTAVYDAIVKALPIKKDNVKNVMVKFTMSKPIKVEMK